MSATEHSPLGASSAHRWTACPGSVALSAGIPRRSSSYAAEGSAAHYVAWQCLYRNTDAWSWIGRVLNFDGYEITITREMAKAVQTYLDYIGATPKDDMRIEALFKLSKIDDRLWGTSDAVLWQAEDRRLIVVDYKHGAGVRVRAEGNVQLSYYALGALMQHGYPALTVRTVIVQPNIDWGDGEPIRSEEFDALELLDFAADLREAVRRVDERPNEYTPGDHCQFCPGQAICPALTAKAKELAVQDFTPAAYSSEQLGQILDWLPRLDKWASAVREFAYNECVAGRTVPGYKLVDKRGTRVWADEQKAVTAMLAAGLKDDDMYEQKLCSPAQAEKMLGKKGFLPVSGHVVMHSSGTALVPESDKRPAVNSAAEDFKAFPHA